MNIIVAVDENWGIGKNGQLLRPIKQDLKALKTRTVGNVVVMGRKTFESLPNRKPLPKRENIILTRNKGYKVPGVTVCNSKEELFQELDKYESRDVFILGGEQIYKEFLPFCEKVYVTKIKEKFDADTTFPNLDDFTKWECIWESEELACDDGLIFKFCTYEKRS